MKRHCQWQPDKFLCHKKSKKVGLDTIPGEPRGVNASHGVGNKVIEVILTNVFPSDAVLLLLTAELQWIWRALREQLIVLLWRMPLKPLLLRHLCSHRLLWLRTGKRLLPHVQPWRGVQHVL